MICHIYPTMMKLGTLILYIKKIHVTQLLSSADISIFSLKVSIHNFSIHNWYIISNCFNFFWVFKDFFSRHGYNFNDVSKMATLGLVKIKVFWNKYYDVIVSVYPFINKILSYGSNYIVDVVMWPKFGNFTISMREVIVTSSFYRSDHKNPFFWGVLIQVQ